MARITLPDVSFNAGELTPRIAARTDFVKYPNGLEEVLNLIPLAEGGLMRRAGSRFVAEINSSTVVGRLKRFEFSTVQAYVLELGEQIMRFFRLQGQITVADTDASVSNGDFASDPLSVAFGQVWQFDDNGSGFVDETTDANDDGNADWTIFPSSEAADDYVAMGYTTTFAQIRLDNANGTAGVGGTVAWEYWNGSAWTALSDVVDGSSGFTASVADNQLVSWTIPSDWAAQVLNGSASLFYVRAKITGTYSTNPVYDQGFVRPVWKDVSTGGAGNQISYDSSNGRLTLETSGTAGSDIGWAEQAITTTNTSQEHVIKFRVVGDAGDKIEFQVGTASLGAQTLAAVEKSVGYHCVAFTPTTSPFYIQFRNLGANADKDVQIDDVSLIDDAGVNIDAPWTESELFEVEGPQSASVLYLFHDNYPPYKLERLGNTTWSLVEVAWQDGPWLDQNATATTLTPAATTGLGIAVTASATAGINDGDGFKSTDVGRLVRISNPASGTEWGWARIVSFTNTTTIGVDIESAFSTTNASAVWRLGAWSDTTGWPRTGSFFEQRLFVGWTTDQPQTFWATQTADFENFSPDNIDGTNDGTVEDDDALDFTLSADDVNAIRWMSAGEDTLVIGTTGGEWVPSSVGAVLTPTDITVRRQTTHGSSTAQPIRVGQATLFVQRAGRKLREFGFSFETDGFVAPDMTRLASHITKGGIVEIAYQQEPDSLVWAVRADGVLLCMTFRRDEDVVAWSRHIPGGKLYGSIKKVWQVDDSAETFTDETTDANDAGNADWTVFPATEAVGDYAAFGFTKKFSELVFDYANGTAGVDGVVTWEYWNGSIWTALSGVTDNTTGFTASVADDLSVTWTMPKDWDLRVVSSGPPLFYVRARITTVYSTNPVLDQGFIPDDPKVESIAVIPGVDGAGQTHSSQDRDEVWMIVKRTVNGATKRYVEFLERDFETGQDQEDACYADSSITYDGAAATTLTGLTHLEGETVKVWGDGAIFPDEVVASGQITLATSVEVAQIGLPYKHSMKTLKIEGGNPSGTALGKTKRINGVTFIVLNSHTVDFGEDADDLTPIDFRVVDDPIDAGAPLFTGERFRETETDWNTDTRIIVESDDPAPFMLLGLIPDVDVRGLV